MLPLLGFHLRTAVRLAARAMTPVAMALVAAAVLANEPAAIVRGLAEACVGRTAHPAASPVVVAAILTIASWIARRTTHGMNGWARSLAVGDRAHLDAAAAAIVLALMPVSVALIVVGLAGGVDVSPARATGLAVSLVAVTAAVLPVRRRRLTGTLGVVAGWLALEGGWIGVLLAGVVAATARALSGGLATTPASPTRPRRQRSSAALGPLIALRALGHRIAAPALGALVVGLVAAAFAVNNELDPAVAAAAERLAAVAAVTVVVAGLAELLAVRRPTWPWARSLPVSALARAAADAALLGASAVPVLAAAAVVAPLPALAALAATPTIAAVAAGSVRRAAVRASGASGEVLAAGLLAAAWIALAPVVSLGLLAALPPALLWAAERDRRLKATAWHERHHLAVGDPLSWSGR